MSFRRSKRSIKTRKFYTAGKRADGKWVDSVEEASTTAMSIREEGSMQRPIQWQAILQREVEYDSDATVVMKDDDDQDAYLQVVMNQKWKGENWKRTWENAIRYVQRMMRYISNRCCRQELIQIMLFL
jgi:hypothetical protein